MASKTLAARVGWLSLLLVRLLSVHIQRREYGIWGLSDDLTLQCNQEEQMVSLSCNKALALFKLPYDRARFIQPASTSSANMRPVI
jgi:hypothetical protein